MSATGVALRTAQLHRANRHPDWVAWEAGRLHEKVLGSQITAAGPVEEPAVKLDLSGTAEEAMERAAFLTWKAIAEQIQKAQNLRQFEKLPGLLKAEIEAQKSHRIASANRKAADVERGVLVPLAALEPLWEAVSGVASLLRNAPKELGVKANPTDAGFGTAAVQQWVHQRLNPQLEEVEAVVVRLTAAKEAPGDEGAG